MMSCFHPEGLQDLALAGWKLCGLSCSVAEKKHWEAGSKLVVQEIHMDGSEEPEVRGKASNLKHAVKEAQLAQFTRFQKYIRKKKSLYFVVKWWCSSKGWRKWYLILIYFDLFCPLILVLVLAPEKYILAPSTRPNWWKRDIFSCVFTLTSAMALWLFTSQFAFVAFVAFVGAGLCVLLLWRLSMPNTFFWWFSLCDLQTWWRAVSFLRLRPPGHHRIS